MPRAERTLRISFDSPESFEREYVTNLSNAGVFVATDEAFELRESVQVEIYLDFCDQSVAIAGEVVHHVPPEMAARGGTPGVAVQFALLAHQVRHELAPLVQASGSFQQEPHDSGRRSAPRVPARVPATIDVSGGAVAAQTRNLSRSGVLVSVPGTEVPVGERVDLTLVHPTNGRSMQVGGKVVREVRNAGEVRALGIHFEPPEAHERRFHEFVEEIQSAEHSRRLGGISGSIAELGPQNLLQMFGTSAREGTLTLVHGDLEGSVGFGGGLLRYARVGSATGLKALTRLMAWTDGGFEFHARVEDQDSSEPPLPLEAAILEAMRQLDELAQLDLRALPPRAVLRVLDADALSGAAPSKTEEAVFDLARAGFRIHRIVEVIPEPDPQIYRAIVGLVDRGVLGTET